ncbi:PucR family transcriptional regulator [Tetragenococcus halophilus]|uniref:PucR family transcriptional regulator n=1 Tax=Tetragenococcus halophilus TaxID=51669 RepID=UPI000B926961|nr:PucR family transcriptional regulator [Tetragenococcus halophilus]MCO7025755.1 PucR family transcriptional regulator ligand-binding domain-containing protein [Tetragenococcus halophilus]MCO8290554.1 PucR family transcriptional regulator [Tetragenococcus halophilus]MCO8295735.1 PucR family transcriptional regulator [Tetragenococcus halophilus]NWO00169.1 PucR family transcriptional regulator [Tetragenococcus halophilus]WJS82185.1 PucR family transcriptional regulator [Tetragenococcus halophil
MNIAEFLKLPMAHNFKLLTGDDLGMDHNITGANILDNPKADDWLTAGELIITSGYFFYENYAQQKRYFQHFQELNIAAVCIKTGQFFKEIPSDLIKLSQQLEIPLIEIPYGIAFSKILKMIMNQLSSDLASEQQFTLDIYSQFFESSLNNGGIDYIAKKLRAIVENPVLVTTSNWEVLSLTGFENELRTSLMKQGKAYHFPKQNLQNLPKNVEQLQHPFYRKLYKNGQEILCCVMPIFFNQINYGYIIVYLTNRSLVNTDHIALESCTMSIALEVAHQIEKERVNNQVYRDFFARLFAGKITDVETLRSFNIDINVELEYSVYIISVYFPKLTDKTLFEQRKYEEQAMQMLLSALHRYIQNNFLDSNVFKQGNQLIGLLGNAKETKKAAIQAEQSKVLKRLLKYLKQQINRTLHFSVVVGSSQSVLSVAKSYSEATNMLKTIAAKQTGIHFLNEFYLDTFLSEQISTQAAAEFSAHYLYKLIAYDQKNQLNLLQTLASYLANHQNIAVTARKLYIHRNTLIYRIERIENILAIDITEPNIALSLQLALKFYQENELE